MSGDFPNAATSLPASSSMLGSGSKFRLQNDLQVQVFMRWTDILSSKIPEQLLLDLAGTAIGAVVFGDLGMSAVLLLSQHPSLSPIMS